MFKAEFTSVARTIGVVLFRGGFRRKNETEIQMLTNI